jgi:hypothetical protein
MSERLLNDMSDAIGKSMIVLTCNATAVAGGAVVHSQLCPLHGETIELVRAERDRWRNAAADAEEALIRQGGRLQFAEEQLAGVEWGVAWSDRDWRTGGWVKPYPDRAGAERFLASPYVAMYGPAHLVRRTVGPWQTTPATTEREGAGDE